MGRGKRGVGGGLVEQKRVELTYNLVIADVQLVDIWRE